MQTFPHYEELSQCWVGVGEGEGFGGGGRDQSPSPDLFYITSSPKKEILPGRTSMAYSNLSPRIPLR